MMQLRCPHCGAQNHVESKGLEQAAPICVGCGRMFMPPSPEAEAKRRQSTLLPSQSDRSNQPVESTTVSDSAPIPAWSPEKPEESINDSRNTAALGAIPSGQMADDISGILDPIEAAISKTLQQDHPPIRGVTPGGMDTTPLRTENLTESQQPDAGRIGSTEWRVRSARGLVYEFGGLDELRTFLDGRTDLGTLQFSKGITGYAPLSAHPEIQNSKPGREETKQDADPGFPELRALKSRADQKLDIVDNSFDFSSSMNEASVQAEAAPSAPNWKTSDEPLVLDVAKADRRQTDRVGQNRTGGHATLQAASGQSAQRSHGRRVGPRTVFVLILLTFAGSTWFVLQQAKPVESATPSNVQTQKQTAADSPGIKRAIAEFEAGHYTSAANTLERLSIKSRDSQVFKYLAMALHRTNRPEEAKAALETYRLLSRPGGPTSTRVPSEQ